MEEILKITKWLPLVWELQVFIEGTKLLKALWSIPFHPNIPPPAPKFVVQSQLP